MWDWYCEIDRCFGDILVCQIEVEPRDGTDFCAPRVVDFAGDVLDSFDWEGSVTILNYAFAK